MKIQKITRKEILRGHERYAPLDEDTEKNLEVFLVALNSFRQDYGKPMICVSGYRPKVYNDKIGGAENSAHIYCQAADFHDPDGKLKEFCSEEMLEKHDLYMEHPLDTPGWCHLQSRKTKNRIFRRGKSAGRTRTDLKEGPSH